MATEYFYGGKPYSLDPKYGRFIGYQSGFSSISSALDPRTANQIKDATEHLNTGVKNIEVGNVQPNVFEAIPKEHFKEMNRLAKLTGAKLSFHAPMVDPTGITEHGWDKMSQQAAERQLWSAIEKSQELNPGENIVTFHASSVGLPPAEYKIIEKVDGERKEVIKSVLAVMPDGRLTQLKAEERFLTPEGKTKPNYFASDKEVQEELGKKNKEHWDQQLSHMNYYANQGAIVAERLAEKYGPVEEGKILPEKAPGIKEYKEELEKEKKRDLPHADLYLRDAYRAIRENFDMVYKYADEKDKKKLDEFRERVAPKMKNFVEVVKDVKTLKEFADVVEDGVNTLREVNQPNILRPLKDFAIDKSAETTANLAWRGYKEFGSKAPVIALENHPAEASLLTTGEELRDVIKNAQTKFVEIAVKEGISRGEAQDQAKKLIGATWDVGHINMMRRHGYEKEDIIKQTAAVAPFIKKIHLSDNFGFEHTELPMGMGNVPMQEIMKKIGKEGYNIKKVIEAGDWWQHFSPGGKSNPPLVPTLQAFGASAYAGAPGWNQIYGTPAGYFSGYGTILPEQHFQTYGSGFSSLPMELGGQIPSKESKFSGAPMA